MWADCTKAQCLVPAQKFLCKTNQDTQARLEGLEEFESGLDGVGKGVQPLSDSNGQQLSAVQKEIAK